MHFIIFMYFIIFIEEMECGVNDLWTSVNHIDIAVSDAGTASGTAKGSEHRMVQIF